MKKKVKKPIRSLRSGWFLIFSSPSLSHPHPQLTLFFLAYAQNGILKGKFKNACHRPKKTNRSL